jgi:hypothetical protein
MRETAKEINGIDISGGCPVCGKELKDKDSYTRCTECEWFEPDFDGHGPDLDWTDGQAIEIAGLKKIQKMLRESRDYWMTRSNYHAMEADYFKEQMINLKAKVWELTKETK